jgi:hypothetical protein
LSGRTVNLWRPAVRPGCNPDAVAERRRELLDELERYYRSCGWPVERADGETVRAIGVGGVTWIGMAVVQDDLASAAFSDRLLELSNQRMWGDGRRCPLELLPEPECAGELQELLVRLRLSERVPVYSLAA